MAEELKTGALDLLPAVIRTRVLALAAQVLPEVPTVPATLRKVASFTPTRRARLAAAPLAAALTADPEFRRQVAVLSEAGLASDAPDAEVAAVVWLRGEDAATLTTLTDRVAAANEPDPRSVAEVARLRDRLEVQQRDARAARESHRDELGAIKQANAELRRKLGEARATARRERDEAQTAQDREQEHVKSLSERDAEVRRLRAQVAELQSAMERAKGEVKGQRDLGTMRARMLLDTMIDAAAGLRRELALPPVTGAPAAHLEQELAARLDERGTGAATGLGPDSPVVLDQALALPRARLLVDGYNVSRSVWESSTLEAQRARLLRALGPLVARTGAETTVVFDATNAEVRPILTGVPRGVKVIFSPLGTLADDVLSDLVAMEPPGRAVVVVSSDKEVAASAVQAGFRAVGAPALLGLLQA